MSGFQQLNSAKKDIDKTQAALDLAKKSVFVKSYRNKPKISALGKEMDEMVHNYQQQVWKAMRKRSANLADRERELADQEVAYAMVQQNEEAFRIHKAYATCISPPMPKCSPVVTSPRSPNPNRHYFMPQGAALGGVHRQNTY